MSNSCRHRFTLLTVAAAALCLLGSTAAAGVAPQDGVAGPSPARAKVTIMTEDFEDTFPAGP